ncbi:hypothetical protein AB0I94_34460 [Streptomyces sp. NPDC050147]|uniref:hypothetical protein n=1 Tax=Streptomyces sp. NPDC050147 TaxID=3155513 RepID=UPI0034191B02
MTSGSEQARMLRSTSRWLLRRHTPVTAARATAWKNADHSGDWTPVERHLRDGHTQTWWAADARLGGYGPHSPCRLVVATTDAATLPEKAT